MEEEDLRGGSDAVALKRPAKVMWRRSHLHVQLGVVDEILQGVSTRVEVLELCVVGDGAHGGVMWPDHPADVDWLDVGEVGEYSRPRCAGGLQSCKADIRSQPTCSEPPSRLLPYNTNQEVAAAGVSLSDGKAESHHRRRHGRVQRPVTVGVVPDVVEDQ